MIQEILDTPSITKAFEIIKELRPHLNEKTYAAYLADMQKQGYKLFGLSVEGNMVSVAGINIFPVEYTKNLKLETYDA